MEKITTGMGGLAVGPQNMAPKIGAGSKTSGRPVPLQANMFTIHMNQLPVFRYDIDVKMKFGDKLVSLVKKTRDDYVATDNKAKCRAAFVLAKRRYPDVFGSPDGTYYDLQSLLYSLTKLKLDNEKELIIAAKEVLAAPEFKGKTVDSVIVSIKAVTEEFQLTLGDLSFVNSDVECMNHDLAQFLEVATSQKALFDEQFLTYQGGLSYVRRQTRALPGAKFLMNGVQKSVKIIEGSDKSMTVAAVFDPKKTAFHKENYRVVDKVYELKLMNDDGTVTPRNLDNVSSQLKHLYVETRYGKNVRRFDISGVDPKSARQQMFETPDGTQSVEQYLKKRYSITLEYPNAPLVTAKGRRTGTDPKSVKLFFPMEVLYVCPNQRVSSAQQTPQQISEMIRACAMLPKDRQQEMYSHAEALGVNGRAAMPGLAAAQLKVANELLRVEGRSLAPPEIVYKDQKKFAVDPNTGKWKANGNQKPQFLVGAALNNWAMLFISNKPHPAEQNLVKQFANELQQECRKRGMKVNNVKYLDVVAGSLEAVDRAFQRGKKEGLEFMFFIQDSRISVHKDIKFCERKYEIISQDLNMNTAKNVVEMKKFLSLENIVNKTNVKLGGLNYSLIVNAPGTQHLFAKGRLYIGFQVSHPAPLSSEEVARGVLPRTPTVIGIAGNVTKEPAAFVGDVFYQTPRSDQMVSAMKELIFSFANRYKAAVGVAPAEVVIYRNGASEGQYGNLLATEIPIIRSALKEAGARDAKLTLMVVSKLHNVRIMPAAISGVKAPDQNVKPGTVVDTTIVHPAFAEFYLNSHQTLQGSAKTPKYTVIVDDSEFQMSYLELMTYVLSYGHQIVGLPTSLPTPAYVAGRYAERGAMLLSSAKNEKDYADFEQMTNELAYGQSTMADKRINA